MTGENNDRHTGMGDKRPRLASRGARADADRVLVDDHRRVPDETGPRTGRMASPSSGQLERLSHIVTGNQSASASDTTGDLDIRSILGADCPDITSPPVHQSHISNRRICPTKFLWGDRLGLRPKSSSAGGAASIGTFFHKFGETLYRGLGWDVACTESREILEADQQEILGGVGPGSNVIHAKRKVENLESNYHLAAAMAHYYYHRYPMSAEWKILAYEEDVSIKIEGIPKEVEGRIDMIFQDHGGSLARSPAHPLGKPGYWLLDFKTTRFSPSLLARTYSFGTQAKLYRILGDAWLRDHGYEGELLGILHCVIQKPTIKMSGLDRDYEEYEHELKSGPRKGEVEVRRKYTSTEPKFENYRDRVVRWYERTGEYEDVETVEKSVGRYRTLYDGPLLDESFANVLYEQARYHNCLPVLSNFAQHDHSCHNIYGQPCPFIVLCDSPREKWADIIKKDFVVDTSHLDSFKKEDDDSDVSDVSDD